MIEVLHEFYWYLNQYVLFNKNTNHFFTNFCDNWPVYWDHILILPCKVNQLQYIDVLAQDCSNSNYNALELLEFCTKLSIWYKIYTLHGLGCPGVKSLTKQRLIYGQQLGEGDWRVRCCK